MDILTDKQYKNYETISRYASFPIYYHPIDNKWVTGTTAYLDNETSYLNHTVAKNEDYDVLALYYYNNPTYYWIICSFNRIQDPFTPPVPGTVLKIPSLSSVRYSL